MAAVPIGTASSIILSQNDQVYGSVDVSGSGGPTAAPDDYFMLMRDARFNASTPYTRYDHGLQVGYGFAAPDVTFAATISGSSTLMKFLQALHQRNTVGLVPVRRWKIVMRDNSPTTVVNHVLFAGHLHTFGVVKNDGHPGQPIDANIELIIAHRNLATPGDIDKAYDVISGAG